MLKCIGYSLLLLEGKWGRIIFDKDTLKELDMLNHLI